MTSAPAHGPAEQAALVEAFRAGDPLQEIAERHGRSLRAIESRLEKPGLLTTDERMTSDRFPTPQPP